MLLHAARAMLSSLKEHSLDYLDGSCKFFAASPTGSTSISEFASKNLAFPATLVPTTCLYPTVLDRHSRTLNNADLGCVCCDLCVCRGHGTLATRLRRQRTLDRRSMDAETDA